MAGKMHKAVQMVAFNEDPMKACALRERRTPSAGPGQVVVHMLCRPINPSDVLSMQGLYPGWRADSFPITLGHEGMGEVHEVGETVTHLQVGQRVVPLTDSAKTGEGTWQEFIVVPAQAAFPIPDSISNEIASQFVVNPWTACAMLEEVKVPKGKYLLQSAAGSVLGRMIIQLARHQGIKTINLVRRSEQIEELKAIGADEVINYCKENVEERVKQITGGDLAYAAIDAVGGVVTKTLVAAVRQSGEVLVYGALDGEVGQVAIADLLFRDITLRGFWLTAWTGKLPPSRMVEFGATVMQLLASKVMEPLSGEKFPLQRFGEAIRKSLEMGRGGKVFLVNDD